MPLLDLYTSRCYNGILCDTIRSETFMYVNKFSFGIKDVIVYTKNRYDKTNQWISMDDLDSYRSWLNSILEPSLSMSTNFYKRDIKFEYKGSNVYDKLPCDFKFLGCFCYHIDEETNIVTLSVDQIKKVM